jgi:hypothetical protein
MANRKEVCEQIRKMNLQDAVKQHFGDNYTRVSTDKLEQLIKIYSAGMQGADSKSKPKTTATKPAPVKKQAEVTTDNPYEAACLVFLGLLKDDGMLDDLLKKL